MKSSRMPSIRNLRIEKLEDKLPLAADVSFLDVGDSLALRIDTADQAVYFQATEAATNFLWTAVSLSVLTMQMFPVTGPIC